MTMHDIFSRKKEAHKEKEVTIIVDHRERQSLVASLLMKQGISVVFEQLAVGDYLVNNAVIERKTISDLHQSVIDGRIFSQIHELKQCEKHLLVIEGILEEGLYNGRLHGNAIRGLLLSIGLDYEVPVIYTMNEEDTAKYMGVLARRGEKNETGIRVSKILKTRAEQLQFIIEGFPNVGGKKAKELLEKFGTIEKIVRATEEELCHVLGARGKEFKELCVYVWEE